MLKLLELLHAGKLADEVNTKAMVDHLLSCRENQKLTRLLPPGTKVAHKSGSIAAARCEAGIIYSPSGPIAVCVLTDNNKDQSWRDDNAGNRLCADVGLAVYNHFNPPSADGKESFPTSLAYGAAGEIVETLQRSLNARLTPSPQLAVDGDFGPATERAVKRLQREKDLEATGRVGPKTWQHLEPLVTEDPPVLDPQTINRRELPVQPADALDGPPFVTCRAWAIADGQSGELLWSHELDQPLDFASTTKIMTAFLVCRLAEHQPDVLDEEITFSRTADQTTGSTAGVRAGERLTVEQALYGLMLPSGNDAAVALAEHFGDRVAVNGTMPPEPRDPTPPGNYNAFIAAMNDAAGKLGMQNTGFRNPHGMTADGHVTSCRDMLKLVHAALAMDLFREVVSTREYGVQVTGSSGYHRNLHWKNTNKLLPIEGYYGVKTGTTQAAGACLVSACRRGDKKLLMCILGATSSDARYVDSRNLYRWAWQQTAQP